MGRRSCEKGPPTSIECSSLSWRWIPREGEGTTLSQSPECKEGQVHLASVQAEFCEKSFHKHVSKFKASLSCLHDLQDSQLKVTLLHSCISLPKIFHILHTCPPSHLIQAAEVFDSAMRETPIVFTGAPLSNWSWLKASLPSCLGDLNLHGAVLHAPAAFVSSLCKSKPLVEKMVGFSIDLLPSLNDSVHALSNVASRQDCSCLEEIDISHAIDEAQYPSQHCFNSSFAGSRG